MKILASKILLILSLTFLNSCEDPSGYPKLQNQEQLSPAFYYVVINGKEYIDVEKSKCNSRTYQISKHFIGPIDKAIPLNIKECDRITGYATSEWATFTTWLENFRHWLLEF